MVKICFGTTLNKLFQSYVVRATFACSEDSGRWVLTPHHCVILSTNPPTPSL